ncbi:MFS transporter [Streptomyces chartreusis]
MSNAEVAERKTPQSTHVTLRRVLISLIIPTTAMYAMVNGIQQVLVPAQVEAIDAANKVGNLALLTTFAAIGTLIGIPFGGALSDRTRSRYGRRAPWIVVLSGISGVLMIAMAVSPNLLMLGIVYTVLWLVLNMYLGPLFAILPDRVPEDRRGFASSIVALGTPLGVFVGVQIASRTGAFWGYAVLAIVLFVSSLILVLSVREASTLDVVRERDVRTQRPSVWSFFEAFRSRDYTLAFASRFALFLSYYTVSGYLYYTMSDYIGTENLPGKNVAVAVSTLSTISVIAWILVATLFGWLADRLDRRKLFVGISAIALACSMLIPIFVPTWTGMVIYSVFLGISIGTYFAVDLAVMSLVLPNKETVGRDFGILSVATGLPLTMSGALAAGLITYFGGYAALYAFGVIASLISGVTILFIKSIR